MVQNVTLASYQKNTQYHHGIYIIHIVMTSSLKVDSEAIDAGLKENKSYKSECHDNQPHQPRIDRDAEHGSL